MTLHDWVCSEQASAAAAEQRERQRQYAEVAAREAARAREARERARRDYEAAEAQQAEELTKRTEVERRLAAERAAARRAREEAEQPRPRGVASAAPVSPLRKMRLIACMLLMFDKSRTLAILHYERRATCGQHDAAHRGRLRTPMPVPHRAAAACHFGLNALHCGAGGAGNRGRSGTAAADQATAAAAAAARAEEEEREAIRKAEKAVCGAGVGALPRQLRRRAARRQRGARASGRHGHAVSRHGQHAGG